MTTTLDIKRFAEANPKLIQRKESILYPGLYVLKYARRVFYDNLWTAELEYCRGLVVDEDWNIVVQPFRKIYNRFERDTDFPLDEDVIAYKKINGFMAAMTYHPAYPRMIVSTTGSLESEYVELARKQLFKNVGAVDMYQKFVEMDAPQMTIMFEICDPSDPHIVPEIEGAYALASNLRPVWFDMYGPLDTRTDLDASTFFMGIHESLAEKMGTFFVPPIHAKFGKIVEMAETAQHEGYVVYTVGAFESLKIKSPYYLVTKFFSRKSEAKLELLLHGDSWKQIIDEEYYDLVHFLRSIREDFIAMDEQVRTAVVRKWLENRMKD